VKAQCFDFNFPVTGTMFFEVFKTVYEGASVVYSLEAQIHAKEDYMTAHTPVARELITVIRLVPERLDTEYHKPYTIPKVSYVSKNRAIYPGQQHEITV